VPQHDVKVGGHYATGAKGMIRPIFFLDITNSESNTRQIFTQLSENLCNDENVCRFFQQDSATAHVANNQLMLHFWGSNN
jgi:mannitol/fructose-specific phosphotransferase system IIA component (Ntr-type)